MCPIPTNIRRKLHKKTDISHTLALSLHLPQYLRRTHCYTAVFSVLTSPHYSSTAPQTTASPCMWTYPLEGDTVHWVQDGLVKMFVTDSMGLPWTRSSLSASSSYLPCALWEVTKPRLYSLHDALVVASLSSVSYNSHVPFVSMIYFPMDVYFYGMIWNPSRVCLDLNELSM